MERRIADWMYKFWRNNHTHYWIVFTPEMDREKCMYCGEIKNKYGKTN